MKKWIWLPVLLALALAGYVAAGPYLTVNAIRDAIRERDAAALSRQVDFPALRASLKVQLGERLLHEIDARAQGPLAAIGASLAQSMVDGVVDNMVTPIGIGAMMEGRKTWDRANNIAPRGASSADPAQSATPEPLRDAEFHYLSPSRFTATVHDDQGRPVVFVLTREGVRWKLSDIRLP